MQKIIRNVLITLVLGLVCFFVAIIISFYVSLGLPGESGIEQPLFFRFFTYVMDMGSGNWGTSSSIAMGLPVNQLIEQRLPRTIDLLILPLIIGLCVGLLLGYLSIRTRFKIVNRLIQMLCLLGLAFPIILLAMLFQFTLGYLFPIFPTIGFKTYSYPDPTFVTGFRIIDSMLSGQLELIPDYLYHLVLPWITLTISITAFTILITRIYLISRSKKDLETQSIAPFTFSAGLTIGMIFTFLMLTELMFNFYGLAQLLIQAIFNADYYVSNAIVFLFFICFATFITMLPLLFLLFRELKTLYLLKRSRVKHLNEKDVEGSMTTNTTPEPGLRKETVLDKFKGEIKEFSSYLFARLKSPFTLFGLGIIIFTVILTIFPNLLTPYTFEDAIGVYSNPWSPPSSDHPLGQCKFGRDVLARIIYGLSNSLLLGTFSVIIGLAGGLIIGIPLILLKKKYDVPVELLLIPIYIVPMILAFLFEILYSDLLLILLPSFGLYLMPFFVHIIIKARFSFSDISKRVVPYIPLFIGVSIMVYNFLGFLGFSDPRLIQIGAELANARMYVYAAPWAFLFPSIALFIMILGFFILYGGLQKPPSEIQKSFR